MINSKQAITGVSGYTGKYIARRLIAQGQQIINLSGHPDRPHEFGDRVYSFPFDFANPEKLIGHLRGASVLYNTYWVRFDHGNTTFENAITNTLALIRAAKAAGVQRIVHISITNPSPDSPLPYFRGKARLEEAIHNSGMDYAIIRPTVIFGMEDILINNIAFLLRRFPAFAIPGSGDYPLQPIYVEDMADLCVQAGQSEENICLDAVGPDVFSFHQLVRLIANKIHSRSLIFHISPLASLYLSRIVGLLIKDVVLTEDELRGLMAGLLISPNHPTGRTHLGDWLAEHASFVGTQYASELARHYPSNLH